MVQRVEGLSIDLDLNTQKLDRGLAGAKDSLKSVNSEMKANMSAFDRADDSIQKYESRLKGLNKKLKAQERVTEEARKEYDRMVAEHKEGSKEAEKAAREYNKQAAALNNLDRYVNNATEELEQLKEEQRRANSGWTKLSGKLDDYSGKLDKAGEKMTSFGQTMSASVTAPIVGMGALAVESTREFREQMAKLETNAKDAGLGVGSLRDAMKDLSGISDETDSNVEALSNLMATGLNKNQLEQAVEDLSGAVIKFPDTLKIESLADGLQETVATGKAVGPFAELLERMGVDLEKFDEGLENAKGSGDELNYALNELNDLDLSKVNKEFRKTNKELVEANEAQYDFQESFAELGEKLEPIATEITERVTDIVDAFNELEPETQDNIVKFAGLAAAVGPASIALGGATTTLSNVTKGASKLTGMLGNRGGKGLLGGLAGLSKGGVAGLAIGGTVALGAGVYSLYKKYNDLNDVSLETAERMNDQYKSNDKMIDSFSELRDKSKLTNDEFARYVDLNSELQDASDPKVIEDIKKEMADLKEKSGFQNDELKKMVELNGDLTESLPGATEQITEQGKKIIGTKEEMRKYNEEVREAATLEMEGKFQDAAENYNKLLKERSGLQNEVNVSKDYEKQINSVLDNYNDETVKSLSKRLLKERENLEEKRISGDLSREEILKLNDQINLNAKIQRKLQGNKGELRDQLLNLKEQRTENEKSISDNDQKLTQAQQIYKKLQLQYLESAGINREKARQLVQDGNIEQSLNNQITSLQEQKRELIKQTPKAERNTEEFRNAKKQIDEQISGLKEAKGNIAGLEKDAGRYSDELGRDVTKNVNVNANPSISWLDRALGKDVYKSVHVKTLGLSATDTLYRGALGFAKGTDSAPKGPAFLGEEGDELVRRGNKFAVADFGLYNMRQGDQVFTHDESKKIIGALNNMPGYASGASPSGEANRIVSGLNNQSLSLDGQPVVLNVNVTSEIDGRVAGQAVEQYVTEIQQRDKERSERFA